MRIVRTNLILLALLNLTDAFFTSIGLKNNVIKEANPFMDYLWQLDPLFFWSVKSLISGLLVYMFFEFHCDSKNIWKWAVAFSLTVFVYGFINLTHLFWIYLVINQQ